MIRTRYVLAAVAAACLIQPIPAVAGWKLIPAQRPVALSGMTITPQSDWNQASRRPGKQGQAWTHDGFGLNCFELFSGVADGEPLYRERSKKNDPMPKFQSSLLLPELADFFERSFRTQNGVSDFTVVEAEPAMLGGHRALRVRYRFGLPNDDLVREGEVRLAVIRQKLYVANYFAPQLHYFPAGLPEVNAIMDSVRL